MAFLGRVVVAVFGVLVAGCSGGDDETPQDNAATGGSADVGGAGGMTAGGGSSAGGTGTSTAGGAGAGGGGPVCPEGLMEFGAADVDLTLGGLHDDLPAPSRDCLAAEPSASTCIALSLDLGGTQREVTCARLGAQATDGSGAGCTNDDDEGVDLVTKNYGGMTPPSAFTASQIGPNFFTIVAMELSEGALSSQDDGFAEARIAGWVNKWADSKACRNSSWGVIAATWSDSALGEVRARGTFHTRSY